MSIPQLSDAHKEQFNRIMEAGFQGALVLLAANDSSAKRPAALLCARVRIDETKDECLFPLAEVLTTDEAMARFDPGSGIEVKSIGSLTK